jgi:hypothetical protein
MSREVIVPEAPAGRPGEPFDLGSIPMTIRRPLRVGQLAPSFETTTLDGQPIKLDAFRGTNVLLYFHATWAGTYPTELDTLKYLHTNFGTNGDLVILGMNVEHERKAAEDFTRNQQIQWRQCFIGPWAQATIPGMFSVEGVPTAILIGPDGRVRNKNMRGASIRNIVSSWLRPTTRAAVRLDE